MLTEWNVAFENEYRRRIDTQYKKLTFGLLQILSDIQEK